MPMQNPKPPLSRDIRLLMACCQADPEPEHIKELRDYLVEKLAINEGWKSLKSLALRHGVFPLFYDCLKTHARDLIPQQKFQELKSTYLGITGYNMLRSAELIKLVNIAKEKGFLIIPFKGPALAQVAYGNISFRQFSDLDILIQRKDFRTMAEVMLNRGYEPFFPIHTFEGDKVMFEMNNDCPFFNVKRSLFVEVHWDFFRKLALPTKRFKPWETTQQVNIDNDPLTTLSHETHLLYHSLHGSKHVWERLGWIVDIDRFIRAVPHLDWEIILKRAAEMGALKMFLLGVFLARKYFHTPLPEHVGILCENKKFESFAIYVESELKSAIPGSEDSLVKLLKVISLRDTVYYKTITALEFLFRPGINERRSMILSDRFFWFYWVLRPFGMGFRFLFCRLLHLCGPKSKGR